MMKNPENNIYKNITLNYKDILIDEIALEGLEGIGLNLLWRRVEKRISSSVTEKLKKRYWSFLVKLKNISFYKLAEPVPHIDITDRFQIVDGPWDTLKDPETSLDGPYEYCPVENEYGSCVNYHTRTQLPNTDLSLLSYEEVISTYGSHLVLVASLEDRWRALASHQCISYLQQLSTVHYCILELIGKSRENGQMTIGNTNLLKIVKESKLLFYNRKVLQEMDLIRTNYITQKIGDRGVKSILLRLKRYHERDVLTLPKVGKLHSLVEYLSQQPDYSETTDVMIRKGYLTPNQKKFQKTGTGIFEFGDKYVNTGADSNPNKKDKHSVKRRHIYISTKSDESSQSEEESEPPLKCQYKVGVNILRQAYERFLDAGRKGLTQLELAKLVGVEFYTSRGICRFLKSKNIVREMLEDVGRQRTARYIAVAGGNSETKYDNEKKKFLENLNKNIKEEPNTDETPSTSNVNEISEYEINTVTTNEGDIHVIEVKVLDAFRKKNTSPLHNSKKNLTLRQLRYANGILKILEDKQLVSGFQPLSNLVAKEINEPPMDTKALKLFLQKMITDDQIKMYKLKWPDADKIYTTVMCTPSIDLNSPVFQDKCKEVAARAKTRKIADSILLNQCSTSKSLSKYAYPRYVKIRKLHEFLLKMTYFKGTIIDSARDLPYGCMYLLDLIPEMTIEFALGNICDFGSLNITDMTGLKESLKMKLCDGPSHISKAISNSKSFKNTMKGNLRFLALFGLIQIIDQPVTVKFTEIKFYVNQNAKIIDTRGKWPRNADVMSLEKRFTFKSMVNVSEFWDLVYHVSVNTNIVLEQRMQANLKPPVRTINEVRLFDNCEIFGDGNGPCGYDSGFYIDMPRLWRSLNVKTTKTIPKPNIKPVKIPRKKRVNKPKKQVKVAKKFPVRPPPKVADEIRIPVARGKRSVDGIIWSSAEDLILTLCKAAITIISPTTQPGCLSLRNITARDILSVNDINKTQKKCHKRFVMLANNSHRSYEIECLLSEFRRRRELNQKYSGLLKKMRVRYTTNITKSVNETRLPMLELIWILYQITQSKSYMKQTPCIAMSIESFRNNFIMKPTSVHKTYNCYKGQDNSDFEVVIKEAVILTVAMSYSKDVSMNIAKKVFSIFKCYPETVLRKAIDELRKSQAITEKNWANKIYKMNVQDLAECSYKFNAGYYRRCASKLNVDFLNEVNDNLETEYPLDDVKGTPGLNCVSFELQASGKAEIVTAVTPTFMCTSIQNSMQEEHLNVIDIETKYKLKSGSLSLKNLSVKAKKPVDLFKNNDVANLMNELTERAIVRDPDNEEDIGKDLVVVKLENKQEKGSTFHELKVDTKMDAKTLYGRLKDLESKHIIKRVGYYDNRIVLTKYAKKWTIFGDQHFLPSPWFHLNVTVQLEVFFRWADAVVSKIFEAPGCSIAHLTEHFELITAKSVQEICIFLQSSKCITMKVMQNQIVDLFSDDDVEPELLNYNEYESPSNIIVVPEKNVVCAYAYVKKYFNENYGK